MRLICHTVWKYIVHNYMVSLLALYFIIAFTLYKFFALDIFIPCLWTKIFKVNCLGCGLTTAFIKLLSLDIVGAYSSNPLIFIVIPSFIWYALIDFRSFLKN
ncbi:MAG: DUF2752 domain-containing protein [Chitinophagales bacterium]